MPVFVVLVWLLTLCFFDVTGKFESDRRTFHLQLPGWGPPLINWIRSRRK